MSLIRSAAATAALLGVNALALRLRTFDTEAPDIGRMTIPWGTTVRVRAPGTIFLPSVWLP